MSSYQEVTFLQRAELDAWVPGSTAEKRAEGLPICEALESPLPLLLLGGKLAAIDHPSPVARQLATRVVYNRWLDISRGRQ